MDDYYRNQAGSGLGGFSGQRYQKGDGFFGRMLSGTVLPILKKVLPYLGRNLLSTAGDIASDVTQGQKLKDSVKSRFRATASKIGGDAMAKVKQMSGTGRRRRRKYSTKKKTKKPKTANKKRGKKRSTKSKRAADFL